MLDKLKDLYPNRADEVHAKLQKMLVEFPKQKNTLSYSEKDIVLICFPDHVFEEGVKTFQAMRRFLAEYGKNINNVHFLPFYPFSSDRGFSVMDYYSVKDEFGDWADVEAIGRDFGLMFDLVLNHASVQGDYFKKFIDGDPKYKDFFIAYDEEVDVSSVFRPRTHPLLTKFDSSDGLKYVWTTISADQADLNYQNPDVLIEIIKIMLFYIEKGAHILRLDANGYIWKKLGTSCLNLPEAHTIAKLLREIIDQVAPYVWIITETNVPHKDNIAYFGNGDESNLVYNFTLPPLLYYTFFKRSVAKLSEWAATLQNPKNTAFFNFSASHDGIGMTPLNGIVSTKEIEELIKDTKKKGGMIGWRDVPGQDPVAYELNIVYQDAVGGPDALVASQAIELCLKGVPAIYLNTFIGSTNWIKGKKISNRAINEEKFEYSKLKSELDDPDSTRAYVYHALQRLLHARMNEPMFNPAVEQRILDIDDRIFACQRDKLVALTNVTDEVIACGQVIDIVGEKAIDIITQREIELGSLGPYQTLWLRRTTT